MGFATDAIHVGQEPEPTTGAIVAPIYQTSTYVQEALGKNKGYDYARTSHPNRRALERCVAKAGRRQERVRFHFRHGGHRLRFRLLRPGDHAIISRSGLRRRDPAHDAISGAMGTGVQFRGHFIPENIRKALKPNTKMIYVETPTNPTMLRHRHCRDRQGLPRRASARWSWTTRFSAPTCSSRSLLARTSSSTR